jgi:plastocyanin
MKNAIVGVFAILGTFIVSSNAMAIDEYELVIKDHQFQPAELSIPAGQKVKLNIKNLDDTPEEFESDELKREKVIMGKATASVFVGPLEPGVYPFVGEFHPDTAQGKITVK